MTKFKELRIVLLPDEKIQNIASKLAMRASDCGERQFKLDKTHIPHTTIYNAEYPIKNLTKIYSVIKNCLNIYKQFPIISEGLASGWGYVGINFQRTPALISIHEFIVNEANLLREGHLRDKYNSDIKNKLYTPGEAQNIKNYGYPYVFGLYRPHMNFIK